MNNVINLKTNHQDFKIPDIQFSVSGRKITADMSIEVYLKIYYMYTHIPSIESVFGNTLFPSQLYGGRVFNQNHSITDVHIKQLKKFHIGLALTLTNHFFDEDEYKRSFSLLEQHHHHLNSVICTNDELAKRIKSDFPDYTLKASIIKRIDTHKKIERHLQLYDNITLPMDINDDDDFLEKIPEKERIILFANANCAYTCPNRSCYKGFSEKNSDRKKTSNCSKKRIPRSTVYWIW